MDGTGDAGDPIKVGGTDGHGTLATATDDKVCAFALTDWTDGDIIEVDIPSYCFGQYS